jgi:sporulation-control protein spo0M
MNLKEQLLQEIEALPSDRLAEALTFVQSLQIKPSTTSAKSFLAYLKEIGTWSGDDLQECLEAVKNSRGEAQFNYKPNPFE